MVQSEMETPYSLMRAVRTNASSLSAGRAQGFLQHVAPRPISPGHRWPSKGISFPGIARWRRHHHVRQSSRAAPGRRCLLLAGLRAVRLADVNSVPQFERRHSFDWPKFGGTLAHG